MSWGHRGAWESWARVSSATTPNTAPPRSKKTHAAILAKAKSKLELQLAQELELEGIDGFEREFRFHETRRWRFDFAWPTEKIACEVNGGIFKQGRHSRGAGQESDYEKLNAATAAGWFVFQFGPSQVRSGLASLQLSTAVRCRRRVLAAQLQQSVPPAPESV